MGHASPHPIVTTTSAASTASVSSFFGTSAETSIPSSAIAATTEGLSSAAGALPAERTRTRPRAWCSSRAAAIWLRPALCTQTNRTSGTALIATEYPASTRTRRLARPDDGAEHLVGHPVRRNDRDRLEPRQLKPALVLLQRERPGDATHEAPPLGPLLRRELVRRDHVRDTQAAAGPEHAMHLREHLRLVCRQVDHAVRDHHVHARVGQRHVLDVALQELDVVGPGLGGVAPCELQHLVGHVQTERLPGRADPLRRQDHVDPAAGSEVEHGLALPELGHGRRVATPEARHDRRIGDLTALLRRVELGPEDRRDLVAAAPGPAAATALPVRHLERRRPVPLSDPLAHLAHALAPSRSKIVASRPSASRLTEEYAHTPRCPRSSNP